MDKILRPHTAYAAAYLDDIIIYSQDWQRHMVHLREVLRALRGAGLTANPKKCAIGWVEVRYLGFHLGHGQVRPQIVKTAAIAACPRPKTKRRWGSSWGWRDITEGLFLIIRSSPARWLTSLKRRSQIRSSGRSSVSRLSPKWRLLCVAGRYYTLLTFLSPSCCRRTHRTGGWEPSWPRR